MGERDRAVAPLSQAVEHFGPGHHLALLAASEAEESALLVPWLRVGLESRQPCVYLAPEKRLGRLRRLLPAKELDLETAVSSGSLRVLALPRDAERLARLLRDAAGGAEAGLRVVLDFEDGDSGERLLLRERALTQVQTEFPCLVLCLYDRRRFRPEALIRIVHCHPWIVHGGLVCRNYQYRPPEALLRPERELEWLIENICAIERFISALPGEAPPPVADGSLPGGCQECLRRIAALEEVQGRLRETEALARLSSQLAGEFNNRLTVILGYAEMLLREPAGSSRCQEFAREILRASQQASALTERILAFSRRLRPQRRRLDWNAQLAQSLPSLREVLGPHLELRFQPAPDLWLVEADADLLEQALRDALATLRGSLLPGNTVTLETANRELRRPEGDLLAGRYVTLRIRDDGPGLDEATRARLFDPVFTFTQSGALPGLWSAQAILRQHGGALSWEGPPAGPSQFVFFLPAAPSREKPRSATR